ncbi:unnamed protein product, partial [Effrenium voratum]
MGCDGHALNQRYRERPIVEPATGGGHCSFPVKETEPCHPPKSTAEPTECNITDWSDWGECSASCEGQMVRKREVDDSSGNCFVQDMLVLEEMGSCGPASCELPGDCKLGTWSLWGPCSEDCGGGIMERQRALNGSHSCKADLAEVAPCNTQACPKRDCQWSDWDAWSDCSCTCGGGEKRRLRTIQVYPENGGKSCGGENTSEIGLCNTQSCEAECEDGQWGQWEHWSACSASCLPSFRTRHREQVQSPNHCGISATGVQDDFEVCNATNSGLGECQPDLDAQLGEWGDWSGCSCSCNGVRTRYRTVLQYAQGRGKQLHEAPLVEVQPCNPGIGELEPPLCSPHVGAPQPGNFSEWEDWSHCTASCGGGFQERSRIIISQAQKGGRLLDGPTEQVVQCGLTSCPLPNDCVDCEMGAWTAWGACKVGQRFRTRMVRRHHNYCGLPCPHEATREVIPCE